MKRTLPTWICAALLAPMVLNAQDYTTPDQYAFTVESDLVYGVDTNYLGLLDTLMLDVYKPIGNPYTERPLAVFVHGGSWLGGCKDDLNGIVPLLHQFVERGYVVASVNYRLGWHKSDQVDQPVAGVQPSPWPDAYRAFYALDSAELKRAVYRGMQDVKGAIRYMKARAEQDSVCVEKVFVGGESAGGYIALATAFLDRDEERPAACGALNDAPTPDVQLLNLSGLNCAVRLFNATGAMLERPDLGPVDGDLNQNGISTRVRGVANFFGGVPSEAFTLDWWQGVDTPSVHLYHQTCDGIVLSGTGQPMSTISANCNLGATPWHLNYPVMHGSVAIADHFGTMDPAPDHITDFLPCPAFDPGIALFECVRYGNNGSYHFTNGMAARAQILADHWAPIATATDACLSNSVQTAYHPDLRLFPQPASDLLHLPAWRNTEVRILDLQGREYARRRTTDGLLDVRDLPPGSYLLVRAGTDGPVARFMVMR